MLLPRWVLNGHVSTRAAFEKANFVNVPVQFNANAIPTDSTARDTFIADMKTAFANYWTAKSPLYPPLYQGFGPYPGCDYSLAPSNIIVVASTVSFN